MAPDRAGPGHVLRVAGDDVNMQLRDNIAEIGDIELGDRLTHHIRRAAHHLFGHMQIAAQFGVFGLAQFSQFREACSPRQEHQPREARILLQTHLTQAQLTNPHGGGFDARINSKLSHWSVFRRRMRQNIKASFV